MRVIGTGLPRTGTMSTRVALDTLGFGPTYHQAALIDDPAAVAAWQATLDGHPEWETALKGYGSMVGWPGAYFFRDLVERFPDAKVVHTFRDPAAWATSIRETVWATHHGNDIVHHISAALGQIDPEWAAYLRLMSALLWDLQSGSLASAADGETSALIEAFHEHTAAVAAAVPADQMLIWNPAEGWEPLCGFLGVPVPQRPVPRTFDGTEYRRRIVEMGLLKLQTYWARTSGPVTGPSAPSA